MEKIAFKDAIEYFLNKYAIPYTIDEENDLFNIYNSFDFFVQYTDPKNQKQGCRYGFIIWEEGDDENAFEFLDNIKNCNLKRLEVEMAGAEYIEATAQLLFTDVFYKIRKDYSREELLEDMSLRLRRDFKDILCDLKKIAEYTSRDVSKLRVGRFNSGEYVYSDTILQKVRFVKDASGNIKAKFGDRLELLHYIKKLFCQIIEEFNDYDYMLHIAEDEYEYGEYSMIDGTLIIQSSRKIIPIVNALDRITDIEVSLEGNSEEGEYLILDILLTDTSILTQETDMQTGEIEVKYHKESNTQYNDVVEDYFFENYFPRVIGPGKAEVCTVFNHVIEVSEAEEWFPGDLSMDKSGNVLVDGEKTGICFSDITDISWGYDYCWECPYVDVFVNIGAISDAVRFYDQGVWICVPGVGDCETVEKIFDIIKQNRIHIED